MLVTTTTILAYIGISIFLIFQTRKYVTQILLVPFVYSMGRAIYLDLYPSDRYFANITPHDIMFVLLLIATFRIVKRRSAYKLSKIKNTFILPFILMTSLVIFESLLSFSETLAQGNIGVLSLLNSRLHLFLPISFFLFINIMRHMCLEEMFKFLQSISNITLALIFLYIVNSGFGITVYPYATYLTTTFGSSTIIRDFLTFPFWTPLAFCYTLVAPYSFKKYTLHLLLLIIGIGLTYTRSLLLSSLTVIFLYLISTFFISIPNRLQKAVYLLLIISLVIVIIFFSPFSNHSSTLYWSSRLSTISFHNGSIEDNNLQCRENNFSSAYNDIKDNNFLLGIGFFSKREHNFRSSPSDSDWPYILHIMGITGLILYSLPILISVFSSLVTINSKSDHKRKVMALIVLFYMVFFISNTLVSQYLYFWNVLAPFGFALAAVNSSNAWSKPQLKKAHQNQMSDSFSLQKY